MEGLPKLPGFDFENRVKLRHHLSHSLGYKNGYRTALKPPRGIGGDPIQDDSIQFCSSTNDPTLYDPILTYGRVKIPPVPPFRPNYVLYDKMALTFFAFFKQSIPESAIEHYRIRHVKIIYFLEDDTLTVMEPCVKNAGFNQGRLCRRAKIQKNTRGEFYTWKDFNIGIDLEINGTVYHITECDPFTTEFLNSQGVELNESECAPADPVTINRLVSNDRKIRTPHAPDDKLRRYLEFQGKVLHFDCVLDETDREFGECMSFKLFYYLEDDTVAIKELKENRDGRDHFPMLLKKTKLPKNWKRKPVDYPEIYMELSDNEVTEYYQPKDFRVGGTIFAFGRKFLLLDCDLFTRKYYDDVLKQPQTDKLKIKFPEKPVPRRLIPDYIGIGTPEDSMASCHNLVPKPPKKDVINYLLNANKNLRYGCILDNAHPEDQIRKFILKYSLSDGLISISEPPIRNSGITGGKFLGAQKVVRPGCDPNSPHYYNPKDFYIGASLIINFHRFKIISADLYVYRYMQENPEVFSPESISSIRNYHLIHGNLKDDLNEAGKIDCQEFQAGTFSEKRQELDGMEQCLRNVNIQDQYIPPGPPEPDILRDPHYTGETRDCAYQIKTPILEKETIDVNNGYQENDHEYLEYHKNNDKHVRFHE